MQHVTAAPPLTCDPVRLVEEFPRWLERVSSKLPGGVILVLDSIDKFQVFKHNKHIQRRDGRKKGSKIERKKRGEGGRIKENFRK